MISTWWNPVITAKLLLRDLINATLGFERLAEEVHKPSKSLHRMLSASGNPTMENLSAILATFNSPATSGAVIKPAEKAGFFVIYVSLRPIQSIDEVFCSAKENYMLHISTIISISEI
jgi:hypothetical protein